MIVNSFYLAVCRDLPVSTPLHGCIHYRWTPVILRAAALHRIYVFCHLQVSDLRNYAALASSLWQSSNLVNNKKVGTYYAACLDLDDRGVYFTMVSAIGHSPVIIEVSAVNVTSIAPARMLGVTFPSVSASSNLQLDRSFWGLNFSGCQACFH